MSSSQSSPTSIDKISSNVSNLNKIPLINRNLDKSDNKETASVLSDLKSFIINDLGELYNETLKLINENTSASTRFAKYDRNVFKTECFNAHRGTLYMRIGPMFSGKTTWLNGELTQLADQGFSVLKITHDDDVRQDVANCDDGGSTHNSSYKSLSNKITKIRSSNLINIDVSNFHVIGIDESQFFPDLLQMVSKWVEDGGKHVRVVGLDGDAFKRKFGQILDLIPMSDEIVKLKASCRLCLDQLENSNFNGNILSIAGPFTKRLGNSMIQKEIGGSDKYIPVCRYHHSN